MVEQTIPNIHDILKAIRELEKLPAVQAYLALLESLKER
jgi:hypothetical protein